MNEVMFVSDLIYVEYEIKVCVIRAAVLLAQRGKHMREQTGFLQFADKGFLQFTDNGIFVGRCKVFSNAIKRLFDTYKARGSERLLQVEGGEAT